MNIAEKLFLNSLNSMKQVLDLGEFKFGSNSDEFKFYKKQVMDIFYKGLSETFKQLEYDGEIERCSCKAKLRHGYTECSRCHGAGYMNKITIEKTDN